MHGPYPVYHHGGIEDTGLGPFAFTVRCLGCDPESLDTTELKHLPGCDRIFAHGTQLRGGEVTIVEPGDRVTRYRSMDDAYAAYEFAHLDIGREVDFAWGPCNPEAGVSFR